MRRATARRWTGKQSIAGLILSAGFIDRAMFVFSFGSNFSRGYLFFAPPYRPVMKKPVISVRWVTIFLLGLLSLPPLQAQPAIEASGNRSGTKSKPGDQTAAVSPRVDRFGQSWPMKYAGKIRSESELRAAVSAEETWLASLTPGVFDPWGGLPGSREKYNLSATGFFHVAKAGGREVLVTPGGNVFFQLGVCGLMPLDDFTYVEGRESDYDEIPPRTGDFASAWFPGKPGVVSFYLVNWIRKYGRPFNLETWTAQAIHRLRAWGFNSGGAWSPPTQTGVRKKFPYARMLPLDTSPALVELPGTHGLFDPFAEGVAEAVDRIFAERLAPEKNNPLLIGYFLGNEQLFENIPKLVPTLKSNSAAKRRLIQFLREKYAGDIAAFKAGWAVASPMLSFDAFGDIVLPVTTTQAAGDMKTFTDLLVDTYYRITTEAFRRYDPNHLLLGSRWQPGTANNEALVRIAARYIDVISINYYTYAIEQPFLDRLHAWSPGRPMLLSEWYYGCTDEGLGGGKEVASQHERGLAYRNYVENTAVLPYVVGHEWFIYLDQPITGRFLPGSRRKYDGEGNNTGLVNGVDQPYRDFITEAAKTNARIYELMFGHTPPFRFDDPRFAVRAQGGAGKVVNIPQAETTMKIDGVMDDWPGRPGEPVTGRDLVLGGNAGNLSADFRLCWDERNLYLFVQVHDITPAVNRNPATSLWRGDSIELFIGSETAGGTGAPHLADRHMLFAATTDGPSPFHVEDAAIQPTLRFTVIKNVAGDGYAVEAAIPWNALSIEPAGGREFHFDLGLNDSADGTKRDRQLMWNGTARNSSDRGAWGHARLISN